MMRAHNSAHLVGKGRVQREKGQQSVVQEMVVVVDVAMDMDIQKVHVAHRRKIGPSPSAPPGGAGK